MDIYPSLKEREMDIYPSLNTDFLETCEYIHQESLPDTSDIIDQRPICSMLSSKQSEISYGKSGRKFGQGRGTGHVRLACRQYNHASRRLTKEWFKRAI